MAIDNVTPNSLGTDAPSPSQLAQYRRRVAKRGALHVLPPRPRINRVNFVEMELAKARAIIDMVYAMTTGGHDVLTQLDRGSLCEALGDVKDRLQKISQILGKLPRGAAG